MKKAFLLALTVCNLFANTYDIKEQDFVSEIESKKDGFENRLNQERERSKEKIENYTGEILLKAPINLIKLVDPTYVLENEIPKYNKVGQKIGVLYPKGYRFNPIEYMNVLPPDMFVFNACDEAEGKYINNLIKEYESNTKDYILVNSGCKNKDVKSGNFAKKVYFLTKEMVEKFQLEHTISVISVNKEKKRIAIQEVRIDEKTSN